MARDMGLGLLRDSKTVLKRKFRWTLELQPLCKGVGKIGPFFIKTASRPNYEIEETELSFLNAKMFVAGKLTWQDITVSFIDSNQEETANLYKWLALLGSFNAAKSLYHQSSAYKDYCATGTLSMYDGCGNVMEQWTLHDAWPKSANFGDLDYTANDIATVEVVLKYTRATYTSMCPKISFAECCSSCG